MRAGDDGRVDEEKNRARNKATRGNPRRRGGGGNSGGGSRDAFFKVRFDTVKSESFMNA